MFQNLLDGNEINKIDWMNQLELNERTFERDVKTLREFLDNHLDSHQKKILVYSGKNNSYQLNTPGELKFRANEALALTKILLESRAFCREEMDDLIKVILNQVDRANRKSIKDLIKNELFHFQPLNHKKKLFDILWDFSLAIEASRNIKLIYRKANGEQVERIVNPVGIMFSDYYFYVLCDFPKRPLSKNISYRLDRIESYEILKEVFKRPYSERFEEGEFRKRIYAMYQGNLIKFSFEFKGHSIESVLDRFPLATIKEEKNGAYIVEASAYEEGLVMWILSQGDWVKVLTPLNLVEKIRSKIDDMKQQYEY